MTRGAMPLRLNGQGRGSFNRVGIAPRVSTLPTAKVPEQMHLDLIVRCVPRYFRGAKGDYAKRSKPLMIRSISLLYSY